MKTIIIALIVSLTVISCSSADDEMMDAIMQSSPEDNTVVAKGNFISDSHPTSGECSVNEEKTILSLTNFKTDDGPKLLLYLTPEVGSQDFVDLGDLKGVEGDFKYIIPENTDLKKYNHVVVWCVDFSVSFGHAVLE